MRKWFLSLSMSLIACFLTGQAVNHPVSDPVFGEASIRWKMNTPHDIQLNEKTILPESEFFNAYRQSFGLDENYSYPPFKELRDEEGYTHTRYREYYKGIEVAETHYILHARNGMVKRMNSNGIHGLELDTEPSLSREAAARIVREKFPDYRIADLPYIKSAGNLFNLDWIPPKLMISAGNRERKTDNFRLVWRFDIFKETGFKRLNVDVDAHTGEIVGTLPQSYEENINAQGVSLYNGTVDIIVTDTIEQDSAASANWILDDWNAYDGSGVSWRLADTLLGTNGGYRDRWLQALETDTITITGTEPSLSFYHRYSTELPQDYDVFDAWDGMNVQISTDGGENWNVLEDPVPAYDKTSLYSFYYHGYDANIPGWCGLHSHWTGVSISLADYVDMNILIRFMFAADGALSTDASNPDLYGWQIDDIVISNDTDTLYLNTGTPGEIHGVNLNNFEVTYIEGKYRLRETTRAASIGTFNGENIVDSYSDAVDFVEDDLYFSEEINEVGVSVHWAVEETYDFYQEKFGRLSYDGANGTTNSFTTFYFDGNGVNAQYIGGGYMLFGAGQQLFYGPVASIDVVAHEYTHGVTSTTAELIYLNESGALNESFSDIFGKAVEFEAEGVRENWLIADDITLQGDPFRSMEEPNDFGNPNTFMGTYWIATDGSQEDYDGGGVHINSGIQNHWFYLVCEGGSGVNDDGFSYNVDPIDIEEAIQIVYRNLTHYLVPSSDYTEAAYYAIQSAIDLNGEGSDEVATVRNAWEAVGIYMEPAIKVPEQVSVTGTSWSDTPSLMVRIVNKSVAPLEISDLSVIGDNFTIDSMPALPLTITNYYELAITFTPDGDNQESGTLNITSNDPENATVEVLLTGQIITGIEDHTTDPVFGFGEVYPNPFHESTHFSFTLSTPSEVSVTVLNACGESIRNLVSGSMTAGTHTLEWKGTNEMNHKVPPGTYLLVLSADGKVYTRMLSLY